MSTRTITRIALGGAVAFGLLTPLVAHAGGGADTTGARLVGRAVLPVETYAPGPPSGAFFVPPGEE